MFNFFKKNQEILSPVSGKVIDLSKVPDEVFSQRLAGDGVAVEPTSTEIVAPADGVLTLIFNTNHAFALTLKNGVELLIHIGIDTVALNGKGFTRLAEQGTKVKAGTPIVRVDKDFIEKSGYSLVTLALITNTDIVKDINGAVGETAEAGKTPVIEYKMK